MNSSANHRSALLIKLAVASVILCLLVWQAQRHDAFAQLIEGEKQWSILLVGFLMTMVAVALSFVRWYVVARAAGIGLSVADAIRLGALGYALTFVGPGSMGGDLFKVIAVARERKGMRAAAATTVLVDRVIGLAAKLLTASAAILAFHLAGGLPAGLAWFVSQSTLAITVGMLIGFAVLFVSRNSSEHVAERIERLPKIGSVAAQVVRSLQEYLQRPGLLATATTVSLAMDVLIVGSFYCVAIGLPFKAPTFADHFFIVPINLISAALPITPGGVGVREGIVDLLYQGFGTPAGSGTLIAAGHSLMMLAVGGVAVLYYLSERSRGKTLRTCDQNLDNLRSCQRNRP